MARFTREQLYRLAWERPMQQLAETLDMSDVGLAKICRGANVPLPPRGYWAKLRAGKFVDAPPALPPRDFGFMDSIDIGPAPPPSSYTEEKISADPPQPPHFEESIEDISHRARQLVGEVRVPKTLTTPHASLAAYLKRDEDRRVKQRQSLSPAVWDAPLFDSPQERRRLRILNALFATLERCGASAIVSGREARELSAMVGSIQIEFSLEPIRRSRRGTDAATSQAEEPLRFELKWWTSHKPPMTWEDTSSQPLEAQLPEIATQFLVTGEAMLRDWLQQRYDDDLKQRAALIEKARLQREAEERTERERIARARQERIDHLLGEVTDWRRAQDIRAFVHARLQSVTASDSDMALQEWASWALQTADHLDPLQVLKSGIKN